MKRAIRSLCLIFLPILTLAAPAQPFKAAVRVDCDGATAKLRTIADGLRSLGDERPAVLLISGTCRENVLVEALDRVIIQGDPSATIDGGADPSLVAVTISDARSIELRSVTVTGGGLGVGCFNVSLCRLSQVTVRNSLGDGVSVGVGATATLVSTSIQDGGGAGLVVGGGTANLGDVSIVRNAAGGIRLGTVGGFVAVTGGAVTDNGGNGITSTASGVVFLGGTTVSRNVGDGLALQAGSTARVNGSEISGNGGHQVRIGDLSSAVFGAASAVFGTNPPDVVCDPVFSAARGFGKLAGTTTNCPAELPPTP